jgi:type VI secretion system protein ImpE
MEASSPAAQALRDGDPLKALKLLQDQIRSKPADAKLRVFLFQLLCVLGDWDRALNQLNVAGELDATTLHMVQTYREAIQCERLREQVFLGQRVPLLFGQPETWIALLIEAQLRAGRGEVEDAQRLRAEAFEQAPACSGTADGMAFEWIADADMRLGPVLEAIINGKYYWLPWMHMAKIDFDPPVDLRDSVWMPATVQFSNGGETVALIPTRYAGTDLSDPLLALSRKTEWNEPSPGFYTGVGQRLLTTDAGDLPLMDVRSIFINVPEGVATSDDAAEAPAASDAQGAAPAA